MYPNVFCRRRRFAALRFACVFDDIAYLFVPAHMLDGDPCLMRRHYGQQDYGGEARASGVVRRYYRFEQSQSGHHRK